MDVQMVGLVMLDTPESLSLLFVRPDSIRRGIGRKLWDSARAHVENAHPDVDTIELNATPVSVQFYLAVGFTPMSAEFVRAGCRATRMARSLRAGPNGEPA